MADLSTRFFDFLTRKFRRHPNVVSAFIVDWDGTGEKWLCERRSFRIIYNNPRRWYAVAWQEAGKVPPRILVPINKTGRVGAGKAFWSSGSRVFKSELEWPKYFWVAYEPVRHADVYDREKYNALTERPAVGIFKLDKGAAEIGPCIIRCEFQDYLDILAKQAECRLGKAAWDKIAAKAINS